MNPVTVEALRADWNDDFRLTEDQRRALNELDPQTVADALDEAFRPHRDHWHHILDTTRADATRALVTRLEQTSGLPAASAPRYAGAAELDSSGRPLCEGTTHRATRNCPRTADFHLKQPGARTASGYACHRHAGQVARTLADGEAGAEHAYLLTPITTVE
ncbi:hypothetical protein ACH4PU_32835 [Streptomyces sp. NPDC021100]|uniref:hypothetical protein n=1 Tax=Streptomyces sp. NPDC021100 TaxID=3365114 RepID=UPI0037889C50